jgi:hypothetical protein
MYGFDLRDSVWEQRGDITSKTLGTRLIAHLAIVGESGQSIGYIPPARDEVAHHGQGKSSPCANDEQRQRCCGRCCPAR